MNARGGGQESLWLTVQCNNHVNHNTLPVLVSALLFLLMNSQHQVSIVTTQRTEQLISFHPNRRRQVILACRCPDELREVMMDLSKLQTVSLLQAVLFEG